MYENVIPVAGFYEQIDMLPLPRYLRISRRQLTGEPRMSVNHSLPLYPTFRLPLHGISKMTHFAVFKAA